MKFIVIAGGQGTKLWPLSRKNKPKQFQPVVGNTSLFRQNIDILLKAFGPQDIFVSTKRRYTKYVVEEAPEIALENIIIEPDAAKNTGPATGFAVLKVAVRYPKEPFMIVQADCLRKPATEFIKMIKTAEKLVKEKRKLITGGQKALYPNLGIDYLMLGDPIKDGDRPEVFKIKKFIPRPDNYEETEKMIRGFRIATHSNHYCWYPHLWLNAYKKYKPQCYKQLMNIKKIIGKKDENTLVEKIYTKMETFPAEEVTKHIFHRSLIILNPFDWVDMGTWSVIYEYLATKEQEVCKDGEVIAIDTRNSLIKGQKGKLIATIGIDNLLVVDTEDALLICPKSRSQEVSKVIKKLKKRKKKYL